ncbi:TRAP transporter substrate-binding protein [Kroppenstedtia eburnea]|uniref:Tripartite ATP-independent transporter solute receptor, DctP family n=1 Tax=Kroppenstedtia eburnea TaxID=714067 RepID=A0A1N7IZ02_9BACL|nr:TRAP transporter substrate-binding protein [Kroppenstedtia eburnea]QKI82335.1 TRAP transporter substrate-binding protein [Kroppenstedtia eburnea]SIS42201.1 tripartite ATP-independent transporter solute receptor, DctP family [Kroppenstedtia eburnea]
MKKVAWAILLASLLVGLTACQNGNGADGKVVLKLAENQPNDYPTTIGDKAFAEEVEKKTDGRIKVEVHAGGDLGDEKSVIEQVQLGSIHMARVNVVPLSEYTHEIGVLTLPYLFPDEETMWKTLTGSVGDELLKTMEKDQLVGLTYYDSGKRGFYNSKRPIRTPKDLKGLKIRTHQSKLAIDTANSLGASATPMSYEEVYSAIQNGVIDGAENNYPSYFSSSHYEVAKYYTTDGHSTAPEVLMISKSVWDSLSAEDQKVLREAARNSMDVQRKAWNDLVEKSKENVKKNGNEVVEIKDLTPWRKAVQPVYDKHGKEYKQWLDKLEQVK